MDRPVKFVPSSSIVEENGRTVRDNNMAIGHNIPVGTLVEVKYDKWHGGGSCSKVHARLWVIWHTRDCDGTPLYTLGESRDPAVYDYTSRGLEGGFAEGSLTLVEVDDRLREGHGALDWDDG